MKKKILALLVVCSFAIGLTACMPGSGDNKKHKDKDDDEEEQTEVIEESESESESSEISETETEATTSMTRESVETTTTAAVTGDTSIYHEVLLEYEDKMRILENVSYGSIDSCGLTDITGDGFPELIIQYCADEENGLSMDVNADYYMGADLKIFTVIPGESTATEILHVTSSIINAGGGFETYVATLSNGNLLVVSDGGDENWITVYTEYSVEGTTLTQVNRIVHSSTLVESGNDWNYVDEYTLNDVAMTEEEYNAQLDLYEELLTSVLAKGPYTGVYPTTELEEIIPDMPDNILSYDEAWEVTA